MKVLLLTVNYGDSKPTKNLINSLSNFKINKNIKVLIADNSSTEKSKRDLKKIKKYSDLDIIISFNKENKFYWPAIKKLLEENISIKDNKYDWIIISNNDVEVKDKNFFKVLSKLDGKKFPVVGPKIINNKGYNSNPFMIKSFSKLSKLYWKIYFSSFYISRILILAHKLKKMIMYTDIVPDKTKKVYAIHGSLVILSRNFFEAGGYLDSNFELFCEELTLAEISKKINCNIFYVPKLKVFHNEHSSMKLTDEKKIFSYAKKSHKYFLENYLVK